MQQQQQQQQQHRGRRQIRNGKRYLRSVIIAIGLVVIVVVIVSIFSHYLIQIGQPKENGATPIINNDVCEQLPCLNNGTCKIKDEGQGDGVAFTCICISGYTGIYCQTAVDACYPCQVGETCVNTKNSAMCPCDHGYTNTFCRESNKISFFAQAASTPAMSYVTFDQVLVNDGNGFNNKTSSVFKCPKSGFYWFFSTLQWQGTTQARITMRGDNETDYFDLMRLHTTFDRSDTISRSGIYSLSAGQELTLFSHQHIQGDYLSGCSWGTFRLDALMSSLVTFHVSSLLQNFTGKFEIIHLNHGNGWISDSNHFKVPEDGIYYISANIGVKSRNLLGAYFSFGDKEFCTLHLYDTHHPDIDIASRGCLHYFNRGQTIALNFSDGTASSVETKFGLTSLSGFLYSSSNSAFPAWSLQTRSKSSVVKLSKLNKYWKFTNSVTDPLEIWDEQNNLIIIPLSGVYFIEIVGTTASGNCKRSNYYCSFDLGVVKNNYTVLTRLQFLWSASWITRSRSLVARLKYKDTLGVVRLSKDHVMGYDEHVQEISFYGFLLYSD